MGIWWTGRGTRCPPRNPSRGSTASWAWPQLRASSRPQASPHLSSPGNENPILNLILLLLISVKRTCSICVRQFVSKFSWLLFAILSSWETFWWWNPHIVFLTIWFCLGAGINPAMTNLVGQSGLLLGNDFFVGFDGFVNLGIILRGLNYGLTSHFIRDFHCVYYSQFSTRYASRKRSRTRLKGGVDSSTGPGLGCRAGLGGRSNSLSRFGTETTPVLRESKLSLCLLELNWLGININLSWKYVTEYTRKWRDGI